MVCNISIVRVLHTAISSPKTCSLMSRVISRYVGTHDYRLFCLIQIKIGDYGASTVYRLPWETTVHMSTGLCGSEPYIAPEQFLGKRKPTSWFKLPQKPDEFAHASLFLILLN